MRTEIFPVLIHLLYKHAALYAIVALRSEYKHAALYAIVALRSENSSSSSQLAGEYQMEVVGAGPPSSD